MLYNKKIFNRKKNYQIWVGLLNYKNCDLACEFLAIPYDQLSQVRKITANTCNKLVGLEEQKEFNLVGVYKGVEYFLTSMIKISDRKLLLPYKPNIYKKGIKLQIKGRLRGVSKANSYKVSIGNVRTHTFTNMIDYCEKPIQTKWGIFGLKIFLN